MQYIIVDALLQANLLNRTLVIPSFVYARACEYHMYVIYLFLFKPLVASSREQSSLRRLRSDGQPGRRRWQR